MVYKQKDSKLGAHAHVFTGEKEGKRQTSGSKQKPGLQSFMNIVSGRAGTFSLQFCSKGLKDWAKPTSEKMTAHRYKRYLCRFSIFFMNRPKIKKKKHRARQTETQSLTQTPVGNHNMWVTIALLPSPLAPVLDCNGLVGFNNIGDL